MLRTCIVLPILETCSSLLISTSLHSCYLNFVFNNLYTSNQCWWWCTRSIYDYQRGDKCTPAQHLGSLGLAHQASGSSQTLDSSFLCCFGDAFGNIWFSSFVGSFWCTCSVACNDSPYYLHMVELYKRWCNNQNGDIGKEKSGWKQRQAHKKDTITWVWTTNLIRSLDMQSTWCLP